MEKKEFLTKIKNLFEDCYVMVEKKNGDYANSEDPFRNFRASTHVGVNPDRAILVRLSDKIARISNLLDKEAEVEDEKIQDTIQDAINYLAILYLFLQDGKSKNS